jgi:hypothetical protein
VDKEVRKGKIISEKGKYRKEQGNIENYEVVI